MSERDELLEDVCAQPDEWKLRGVLADWCEDDGRPEEAACLRWMVKHRKRPYYGSSPAATWFDASKVAKGLGDPESDVPAKLYAKLEGGKKVANHRTYETRKEAEEAFLAAFLAAKKAGWKPPK